MQSIEIQSLAEYMRQPMWDSDRMIYRGVSDVDYGLMPSIGRIKTQMPQGLQTFEIKVLEDFRRRSVPFLEEPPRSLLEWMFLAQHYGIPTRLMDWTTNPLVALYFACAAEPTKECDFAVYRSVHSTWLSDPSNDSPFDIDIVVAVMPPHSDVRMVNQDGLFTIHPVPREAYKSPSLLKMIFAASVRDRIKWELRKLGYGPARVFPGLDGVARDVVERQWYLLQGGSIRGSDVSHFI